MTPYRRFDVPEVLLSQEVPSGEVRMVPKSPTVTNNPVVVELSVFVVLDELLDEVQDMEMKLKRRREMRMSSRCFTWFPISGLGEPNIYHQSVCFTRKWEGCGVCLTCEELVVVTYK